MWDFPGDPLIKNLLASAEERVPSLVREDPTCCGAVNPACHNY